MIVAPGRRGEFRAGVARAREPWCCDDPGGFETPVPASTQGLAFSHPDPALTRCRLSPLPGATFDVARCGVEVGCAPTQGRFFERSTVIQMISDMTDVDSCIEQEPTATRDALTGGEVA